MQKVKMSLRCRMLAGLAMVAVPSIALAAPVGTPASGNSPPTANSDSLTLRCNSGTGFHATANDTDPDGDPLAVTSAESSAPGLSASVESGAFGIVTIGSPSTPGTYYVYYTISDGQGGTSSSFITVDVTSGGPYCS